MEQAREFERQVIEAIQSTRWDAYNGPAYYSPEKAASSLLGLVKLRNEADKWPVYHSVLSGIGNNHAGTYYPAVLKALPLLLQLLKNSEEEVLRNCTLEIITELYCSFDPDPGTFTAFTATELSDFVRTTIKVNIQEYVRDESRRNKTLLDELLAYFI